jgi:hypothetical protein
MPKFLVTDMRTRITAFNILALRPHHGARVTSSHEYSRVFVMVSLDLATVRTGQYIMYQGHHERKARELMFASIQHV